MKTNSYRIRKDLDAKIKVAAEKAGIKPTHYLQRIVENHFCNFTEV